MFHITRYPLYFSSCFTLDCASGHRQTIRLVQVMYIRTTVGLIFFIKLEIWTSAVLFAAGGRRFERWTEDQILHTHRMNIVDVLIEHVHVRVLLKC